MEWIRQNKRLVGAVVAGIGAALTALGQEEMAALVGMVGAYLVGAGLHKSDAQQKAEAGK